MKFYNINNPKEVVSLKEAVLKSISSENGLYMPEYIPKLPEAFFEMLPGMGLREIAYVVAMNMFGKSIHEKDLEGMVDRSMNFLIPVKTLSENLGVLELFHGPTLAFKDVGARFMAEMFAYFLKEEQKEVTILVATSGDTGGAVADAFYNKQGVNVVILYPSGKVSELQERQLTTLGGNVRALEVTGSFDDCQRMVKQAFSDVKLNRQLNLTSANSINFARLLPQSFYYFHAYSQVYNQRKKLVFSVPSGNFGNLTAGLLAKKMGLPVHRFIAATNENKVVPQYLQSGVYQPKKTVHTITNAMDVGNPSNFPRMQEIYNADLSLIREDVVGYSFSDKETSLAMRELQEKYAYQADPHGAVAYLGLKKYQLYYDEIGIFLETAHPSKFPDEVQNATGRGIVIPERLSILMDRKKHSEKISTDYNNLKEFLLKQEIVL